MREDGIFVDLRRAFPNPQARYARKNAWISEAKWRIIDKRVSAHQDPEKDHSLIQRLGSTIAAILKGESRCQVEEVGAEVVTLLGSDPQLHQEAWYQLKVWYPAAVEHAQPFARVNLEHITAERVNLYILVPPPEANIPVSVEPFSVDDSVPLEDEIEWAVKQLRNHLSGGTFWDAGQATGRVAR